LKSYFYSALSFEGLFLGEALLGDDLVGEVLEGLDPLIGDDSLTSLPIRVF